MGKDYTIKLEMRDGGVEVSLMGPSGPMDNEYLTKSQDFDILLLKTLDIILSRNKIDRRLVGNVEIAGTGSAQALSTMVLTALKKGLEAE